MFNSCQYQRLEIRKVQTPAGNYWSDLGKKASSRQHGFQHLPEPLSEKETNLKKYPGLKLKVFPKSIQFQQLRVTSDCLNCPTSAKLSVRRFPQEWVVSFFFFLHDGI